MRKREGRIFFVYEHWRPDLDACFYVGKGHGRRANVMYGRNTHHQRIQAKLAKLAMCVEVRLVADCLTEDEAHALEIERIAYWRAQGADLANRTAGGEGASDPAEDTRAKMRAAKAGKKLTEEHKRKIAESTKKALSTPEMKERLSKGVKEALNRPEVKAKMSEFQRTRVRTKEHYEKVAAALKGRKLSPEHIEKTRQGNLGRKQTREEIENRRTANTGKKRSAEFCEQMKSMWTPERKAAQAIITAERNRSKRRDKQIQLPLFDEKVR